MSALGDRTGRSTGSHDAFVLPRFLRRPARHLHRWTSGEVEPPRFAALMASALLIGSSVVYGTIVGGHMPSVVQSVTARTGFAIDNIEIVGNRYTSEIDVFQSVGLDGWTSLIGFSAGEARERIAGLPWVEKVEVQKVYPSTLAVTMTERQPFAVWQQGSRLWVIEEDGRVITPLARSQHAELPVLVGSGAEEHAADFLKVMEGFPQLASRTRAYIRVADRRWDLRMRNGTTVKLPAEHYEQALAALVDVDRAQELFARDVSVVDMRLDGKMVLQLSEAAMGERDKMLKDRLGKRYSPEKRT
ncbi:cell division protein FtsQ/DivIB [Aliihoeflea sp. PC F10.4]